MAGGAFHRLCPRCRQRHRNRRDAHPSNVQWGTVEINAAEWIDAVLEGLDDRNCGLAVSNPHPTPKGTITDPSVPPTKIAAESPKASPFFCDFFEIGPPGSGFDYIDADKDLGQDLTFEEI